MLLDDQAFSKRNKLCCARELLPDSAMPTVADGGREPIESAGMSDAESLSIPSSSWSIVSISSSFTEFDTWSVSSSLSSKSLSRSR